MKDNTNRALQYAIKLLEREWEKSGEEKYSDEVDIVELRDLYHLISNEVEQNMKSADSLGEIPFAEYLETSHANYICLRLARKIVKEIARVEKRGSVFGKLALDKEERRYYETLKEKKV